MRAPEQPAEPLLVAIVVPVPSYRDGLSTALREAGFEVDEPEDVSEWVDGEGPRSVVVGVRTGSDWELIASLTKRRPDLVVVVLVHERAPELFTEALARGASGAVPWDAPPALIAAALKAAETGNVMLPLPVAHALATRDGPDSAKEWIDREEVEWLRLLRQGMTISELAEKVGCSERAMYRYLQFLYGKLGASNKTEAILQAVRRGLIE